MLDPPVASVLIIVSRLVAPEVNVVAEIVAAFNTFAVVVPAAVNVVAEIVAAFNTFPVAVPEKVKLLTAGDAVKFTVGKLSVPPVVIFDPGCTLVISFVS